ncbi:MAG: AraC family transcriptional regulator [Lachnospiraceae bacterium]|nr:AraC family transcriptional regulator [Lachnospiraceae bacterium]
MQQFDLTYGDFNPSVFYSVKGKPTHDGMYHIHDCVEMTYILSGECTYRVEGEELLLQSGDLMIANPGVHHQYISKPSAKPPVEFYIGFSDFHFRGMPQNQIVLPDGSHVMHCRQELRQELNQLFHSMVAEFHGSKAGQYFMLKAYLMQILLLIVRENKEEPQLMKNGYIFKSNNKDYVIKKIISYLNENYNSKISLDQIAHNMYLSPVYISKIFKEETGESPINYLIKIRLEKAKEILSSSNGGTVKTIAKMVGYDDVYYFSKLFKKYYGISPLHYRNEKMKSDII